MGELGLHSPWEWYLIKFSTAQYKRKSHSLQTTMTTTICHRLLLTLQFYQHQARKLTVKGLCCFIHRKSKLPEHLPTMCQVLVKTQQGKQMRREKSLNCGLLCRKLGNSTVTSDLWPVSNMLFTRVYFNGKGKKSREKDINCGLHQAGHCNGYLKSIISFSLHNTEKQIREKKLRFKWGEKTNSRSHNIQIHLTPSTQWNISQIDQMITGEIKLRGLLNQWLGSPVNKAEAGLLLWPWLRHQNTGGSDFHTKHSANCSLSC